MEVKQAIKFLRNHFKIGIYEKKSLDIIFLLKRGEKYKTGVEKIIINVSNYLMRMRLDKETLKMNPLREKYLEGYRACLDDIRNQVGELIGLEEVKQDKNNNK